ncbi:MAG: hypothetical protein KatS3mg114_0219 [Planctomycetaceae bacterium]|nr:MAG: hypothetical protein KatS3mg114_0219 [Planctomycetaceae bacterium]
MSLVILSLTAQAWAQETPAQQNAPKITYEQHILPIFREKCGTCHNANDRKGDLVLDNYSALMRGGASGEVVRTDGDAENSYLYQLVAHLSEPYMPPQQPRLPDEQLALIKKWIEGGALENSGSTARSRKNMVVSRAEVRLDRPDGPPPLPEQFHLQPVLVPSRGNTVTALAISPWAPLLAVASHKQILLFHTEYLELMSILPFPEGQPYVLKFSRNGQLLLAAGGRGAQLGLAVLYDVKSGQRLTTAGHEYDVVLAADLSPDQTCIALGGPKRIVRCYQVETGELFYEKTKHTDWITALEFSPDNVLLATADRSNGLLIWEAYTGREFYTLTGHTGPITEVSWSPDANTLVTASEDGTLRLWNMQNGSQIKSINAHAGGVLGVRVARDGRIVSIGRDRTPKLWDASGNAVRSLATLSDIASRIVLCCETERVFVGDLWGQITVFHAKEGNKLGELSTAPPEPHVLLTQTRQQLADLEPRLAELQTIAQPNEQQQQQKASLESKIRFYQTRLQALSQSPTATAMP